MADDIKCDDVKIWVTSFNMAAKTLEFEDPEETKKVKEAIAASVPRGYDVYICGAQELVDENYFTIIEKTLKPLGYRRTMVDNAKVSGRGDGCFLSRKNTTLAIFISTNERDKDKIKVRRCHSCSLGYLEGSKGAASILLDIAGTTIAFLCCHLSSNQPRNKQKNWRFMVEDVGALGDKDFSIISQVHHVVVFGDLNYRIVSLSAEEVLEEITKKESALHLWKDPGRDTMRKDIDSHQAFANFREPQPRGDFLPTYKKIPGRKVEIEVDNTGKLDVKDNSWLNEVYRIKYKEPMYKGGSVADRIPSFTDRLIVHSSKSRIKDLWFEKDSKPYPYQRMRYPDANNYGCIYGLTFSDHTPIYAGLRLKLRHKMKRPPFEFNGEYPKVYRLRLLNIKVETPDLEHTKIKSIRTLFPLHYENGNKGTHCSKKVDFARTKASSVDSRASRKKEISMKELVTLRDAPLPQEEKEVNIWNPAEKLTTEIPSSLGKTSKSAPDDFEKWSVDDVVSWVESMEMGKYSVYAKSFRENGVDGGILSSLSPEALTNFLWGNLKIWNLEDRKHIIHSLRSKTKRDIEEDEPQVYIDDGLSYKKQPTLSEPRLKRYNHESVPDHPAIVLRYRGPHFREMEGGLHCLIKLTLNDGKELEGGFETPFTDFLEDEKAPEKKVVDLFRKGRQLYGSASLEVLSDLVV